MADQQRDGRDRHAAGNSDASQDSCPRRKRLRLLSRTGEDPLHHLGKPERADGHQHHAEHDHAGIDAQPIEQRQPARIARMIEESPEGRRSLAEDEQAEQHAGGIDHAVQLERGDGHQRRARAVAADDEADAEDESAQHARPEVGRRHPDAGEIDQSQGRGEEDQQHRGDDGREHDLQHAHVVEIELGGQVAGVAEAGPLQHEAEEEADDQGHVSCRSRVSKV